MKRIQTIIVSLCLVLPGVALAWPWSTDMMNQPSIKPQEVSPGENAMRPFPHRSIPVAVIENGIVINLTQVKNRDEAKGLKNPIPVSESSLSEGRVLFRIYCAACHGKTGKADSPVSSKIGAISLVEDYVQKNLTEGWVFGTITFGSYVMPAYGAPQMREDKRGSNDLNVLERWNVVNYVKHGLLKDSMAAAKVATAK